MPTYETCQAISPTGNKCRRGGDHQVSLRVSQPLAHHFYNGERIDEWWFDDPSDITVAPYLVRLPPVASMIFYPALRTIELALQHLHEHALAANDVPTLRGIADALELVGSSSRIPPSAAQNDTPATPTTPTTPQELVDRFRGGNASMS